MESLRFFRFSIFSLLYTLAVILWGAYVRATGSGAGCGDHWPLCNGEVIPRAVEIQTWIEYAHRTSSGLSLIFVVIGFFWARRISIPGSRLRLLAGLALVAILLEAALGAGLVLLKLVEFDQSVARAISIALHLMNTVFLVGSLSAVSWTAWKMIRLKANEIGRFEGLSLIPKVVIFRLGLGVFILLGMAGAITALGDTLFPSDSLMEGLSEDFQPGSHFLVRLRVIHPFLAVVWMMLVLAWSKWLERPGLLQVRGWLWTALIVQLSVGVLNWVLMAPHFLQLVHLLMANAVFIAFWISGLEYQWVEEVQKGIAEHEA